MSRYQTTHAYCSTFCTGRSLRDPNHVAVKVSASFSTWYGLGLGVGRFGWCHKHGEPVR
jgi:hypothetical protein